MNKFMNINLKQYQEKAVGELIAVFKTLLSKNEQKKVCVFQAPTGSGKTLMTAKFIEEIIRELPETDLCFVWVSIGKGDLHLQSKHSWSGFLAARREFRWLRKNLPADASGLSATRLSW